MVRSDSQKQAVVACGVHTGVSGDAVGAFGVCDGAGSAGVADVRAVLDPVGGGVRGVGCCATTLALLDTDFHNPADREQCYFSLLDERDECGA